MDVTFEIKEKIGVIKTESTGWKKELNLVSWNGGQTKLDIRSWSPDHTRMTRGMTLSAEETESLTKLLQENKILIMMRMKP